MMRGIMNQEGLITTNSQEKTMTSGPNVDARTDSQAVRDLYNSVESFIENSMIFRRVN